MKSVLFALMMVAATLARGAGAPTDSVRIATPHDQPSPAPGEGVRYSFTDHMLRDRVNAPAQGYLSMSLNMSEMRWYPAPTRFASVLNGAGTAATVGMFLGAIGTTFGWFGEDTTWALVGAMAAAGALYGDARYEPRPHLGVTWDPDR